MLSEKYVKQLSCGGMLMSAQLMDIWQKTLQVIKNELTVVGYNTWIKTIEPVSIDEFSITLGVEVEFNKGILETRYSSLIQNSIKHITQKEYDIIFVALSDETPKNTCSVQPNVIIEESHPSQLNPKYTFDTFVIGNSNRFAHAASLAVAESPSKAYNPLFIYGGVGLGKTHLMQAIGHFIHTQNPSSKILYVSSEKFTNELINALKDNKNEEFRNRYRTIDVLLIDDIQFIAGKERTQEEFFHTFNTLHESNKQIILSSDRPPKEIPTLENRLRSRFEWGLITDIQPPDFETRIAILKKKAQLERLDISNDVLAYIADKIESNIRELEGALNRIVAFASLTNSIINVSVAENALKELFRNKSKIITPARIVEIVSKYYNLKPDEFQSKKRTRNIAYPRQIAMYLCRELTDLSLPKIGDEFGGRDHTTVLHAYSKILDDIQNSSEFKSILEDIKKNILAG